MGKAISKFHIICFAAGLMFFSISTIHAEDPIVFPDEELQKTLKSFYEISNPTPTEMLALEEMYLPEEISDISGLQYARNLSTLKINYKLRDWTFLSEFPSLRRIEIYWNDECRQQYTDEGDKEGFLFTELSKIKTLTELRLSFFPSNALDSIGNLTQIKDLALEYSSTSDITSIRQLNNLEHLYIVLRRLTDCSALSEFKNLKSLSINETQIFDLSPIAALNKLKRLTLRDNSLIDISAISNLDNLTDLEMSNNNIVDLSPISNLRLLEHLIISERENQEVLDVGPLSNLISLKSLAIYSTAIKGIDPLSSLTELTELDLRDTKINDISPLQSLKNLRRLNLESNEITDISGLSDLSNITRLDLSGNCIENLSALLDMKNLDVLTLDGNPLNKEAYKIYLPKIVENNPDIGIGCFCETGYFINDLKLPAGLLLFLTIIIISTIKLYRKKRKYFVFFVLLVILSLIPLPIRQKDIVKTFKYSVDSLINDQCVILVNPRTVLKITYSPFYGSFFINRYKKLYYYNDVIKDEAVFHEIGLEPMPELERDSLPDYEKCSIIGFSHFEEWEHESNPNEIHFNYHYGSLGGNGYKVIMYRNIFGIFPFYVFEWVS